MMDAPPSAPDRPAHRRPGVGRVALVLQGGGALGAYQGGVVEALTDADIQPDWVTGVSIGAINAALIAGNPPERRVERLHAFWDRVTAPSLWPATPFGMPVWDVWRRAVNLGSALGAITSGQPGFFKPAVPPPWLATPGSPTATAIYDTAPLRTTLEALVDFDRINAREVRFAVGAVSVTTGNFVWFDNARTTIRPEHVMASGALPPALPAIQVGEDWFWDGGLVSNTPLQHLLDEPDEGRSSLVFQVDLFTASGALPRDLEEVAAREKEVRYSSRTRYNTDLYKRLHGWKLRLREALAKVPDDRLSPDERALRDELATLPEVAVLQLIYRPQAYEGGTRDYEFSAASMREHWAAGRADTRATLQRQDWLTLSHADGGLVSHDIRHPDATPGSPAPPG